MGDWQHKIFPWYGSAPRVAIGGVDKIEWRTTGTTTNSNVDALASSAVRQPGAAMGRCDLILFNTGGSNGLTYTIIGRMSLVAGAQTLNLVAATNLAQSTNTGILSINGAVRSITVNVKAQVNDSQTTYELQVVWTPST